jgi:hypothetical protein
VEQRQKIEQQAQTLDTRLRDHQRSLYSLQML